MRGEVRPELLKGKPPPDRCDLRGLVELGFAIDDSALKAAGALTPGTLLEILLPWESAALEGRLKEAGVSFWVEESPSAFHYLVWR